MGSNETSGPEVRKAGRGSFDVWKELKLAGIDGKV
jgi:hypothetical protein